LDSLNNVTGSGYYRSARQAARSSKKVSIVTLASGQKIAFIKPYIIPNVRNGRTVKNRPTIWLEATLEARDQMALSVAANYITYLLNKCTSNCMYNYAIVPLVVGEKAYAYAATVDPAWRKTRQDTGEGNYGVNLLENFKYGNWSEGSSDKATQVYKGESPMSAPETQYQVLKNATNPNNRLSVTFSSRGGKLSFPFAYTTTPIGASANYTAILKEYKDAAALSLSGTNYQIGPFGGIDYRAYGHPMDYNYNQYPGPSINIAFGLNQTLAADIKKNVDEFNKGINAVIRKVKQVDNWPL